MCSKLVASISSFGKITFVKAILLMALAGCTNGGYSPIGESLESNIELVQGADTSRNILVVAHRSCWRLAAENSIKSIEECIRIGVDMVEIDARRTLDGHLVLMHDETVDRTTNGSGLASELTLAEITALKLRAGEGGPEALVTDEHVPTLEEALSVANGKILINIDTKGDQEQVRNESLVLVEKLDMAGQILIKMVLTSPEGYDLKGSSFFGQVSFMPIIFERDGNLSTMIKSFSSVDTYGFEIIYKTEQQLSEACALLIADNSRCWVNTFWDRLAPGHSDEVALLDPDAHWGHLVNLGVDMFQTDSPTALISYLQSKGLHQP